MRIEIVVDVPDVHDAAAVDAVRLGQEVARLASNDLHGLPTELVHVAVGDAADIIVPRDYADTPVNATYVEPEVRVDTTPHHEEPTVDPTGPAPYVVTAPDPALEGDESTLTPIEADPSVQTHVDAQGERDHLTEQETQPASTEDTDDGRQDTAAAPEQER